MPELVGGSADLAPSTLTLINGGGDVEKGAYGGRNLHFGIREHGMGAIVNGLVLSGFRAFGATFLIFSDYMKGAIRLAAIMGIPSIFVFTHDSIGLGEDGPTHQPIEQLAALRATPNLVRRAAGRLQRDRAGWQFALQQTETPVGVRALAPGPAGAGTRPACRATRSSAAPTSCARREGGDPEVILMATGSEVAHRTRRRRRSLEARRRAGALVSMPCMDRFAEQDAGLPRLGAAAGGARARGRRGREPVGWYRWVGDDGDVVGMEAFGASAPGQGALPALRLHRRGVAERARAVLQRAS